MKTRYLILATIALLLQSCYSDIEFKGLMPEPVPVINAVATPDTVVMASISRSYSYEENLGDLYVKDADVSLYVNGTLHGKMQGKEVSTHPVVDSGGVTEELSRKWIYTSDYVPSPGDDIKIEAATRYGTASVSDVIPQPAYVESVTFDAVRHDGNEWTTQVSYDVTYHVRINDKPGERNYYMLGVRHKDTSDWSFIRIYLTDPVFGMQNQDITDIGSDTPYTMTVTVFDDTMFDGTTYDLRFEEYAYDGYNSIGYWQDSMEREVILYSITEDYYKYMRSVQKDMHRDDSTLGDLGIYEPIFIHNSVDGGAGALSPQSAGATKLTIE